MSLLIPDVKAPERPSLAEMAASSETPRTGEAANAKFGVMYLRSYLLMRTIIGFTGIALPIVLIGGDHLLDSNAPTVRASLSAYYYSGHARLLRRRHGRLGVCSSSRTGCSRRA